MAGDNFQDNVKLDSATRLVAEGPAIVIGTDPGAKSVILKNNLGELHVVGNPTGDQTVVLPGTNGTLILSGQAVQGIGVSTGGNTAGSTGTTIGTVVLVGAGVITLSQSTSAGSLATISISAPAQSTQPAVGGFGISTGGNTSGTSGTQSGTVVLVGNNGITLSQVTDTNGVTVTISGNNGGNIAAIGVSTGGNTAGTTGTTIGTMVLAGIGNVTLSQATAAGSLATITISVGDPTLRSYSFPDQPAGSFGSSNAGFSLMPVQIPVDVNATKVVILAHLTAATNSTGSVLFSLGVYTLSGSTASLASSTVRQFSWTTGTTNSTATTALGGQSGTRYRSFDLGGTWAFTPGNYLFGFWGRSSNAGSWTFWGMDQTLSIAGGGEANDTQFFLPGFSTSSFTTAMPASINVTDTNYVRTGVSAYRQPGYLLMGP